MAKKLRGFLVLFPARVPIVSGIELIDALRESGKSLRELEASQDAIRREIGFGGLITRRFDDYKRAMAYLAGVGIGGFRSDAKMLLHLRAIIDNMLKKLEK